MNKPTNERAATAQSGYHAGNAGGSCIGADVAAASAIAAKHADKRHTENGDGPGRNGSIETQQTHRDGRFYLPSGFTRHCDQCDAAYVAKRDTSRYCCGACRVAAHRARHEAEAGKGQARAAVAVAWLVAIIGLAWFLAPLASDLAAMRPRLQGAAAAVNQAAPIAPAIPTPFPKLGEPNPAPAGLIRIEAGGRVWELPMDRLNDCIIAQTAGRRTGNNCPPNAAAALAGAGLPQMAAPGAAVLVGDGAELLHPEAAYIDVGRYGPSIDYCLVGNWTPDQRAAVASGFNVWQAAGVAFYEAASFGECETAVSWAGDLGKNVAGRASVGPGDIWLSDYWAGAGGCNLAATAAHEAGHILGLNDQAAGVMGNTTCAQIEPTAAELAAVASLWGTK